MRRLAKGYFLTLEGIEGSGKTTQISNIISYLDKKGIPALATREPGGTPIADAIRRLLLEGGTESLSPTTELLLYNAARSQHLEGVIRPALAAGTTVVCDRFTDATLAYQGYGRGLTLATVQAINRVATGGLKPDLTFLLDCEPSKGIARSLGRLRATGSPENRFEQENLSFHEQVRNGYLAIARQEPERVVVIPANDPSEAVFAAIQTILEERL